MHIVMTGATAGIGLVAAQQLIAAGATMAIGARSPSAAPAALAGSAQLSHLDLGDLYSVRAFALGVEAGPPVDVLLLNAGLQNLNGLSSAQGLDISFAANHLAHYLLVRRLLGRMAPGGRIVLTSSGTHDPEEGTRVPSPRHADARRLAYPETDPDLDKSRMTAGLRAYSASKLCNVMTARELARRTSQTHPDLSIAAFDPGFTPGTGLARDYPGLVGFLFRNIVPLVARGPRVSTPSNSGRLLAGLAMSPDSEPVRGAYFAVRGVTLPVVAPSLLARDDAACARIWEDSEALLREVAPGALA